MMQLLFASHNSGKIKEAQSVLAADSDALEVELVSLTDLPQINPDWQSLAQLDVAETGDSYEENALLKAQPFAKKTQLPTIAEDSGLEVSALDKFPGVKSKRWLPGSPQRRNQTLLDKMTNVTDRTARLIAVICLYHPQKKEHHFFQGIVAGTIADQVKGQEGFGYDPIFIPDGYERTFAQLGVNIKNKLSHRRRALEKLKQYLVTQLS